MEEEFRSRNQMTTPIIRDNTLRFVTLECFQNGRRLSVKKNCRKFDFAQYIVYLLI